MNAAIIDCGTNTFNIIVVEINSKKAKLLYKQEIAVKIGKGGINNELLTPSAIERGLNALTEYAKIIEKFQCERKIVLATSAVRDAKNGEDFTDLVKEKTGLEIEIISGDREAELIYKGVRQAVPFTSDHTLIMDIGGGSTEFIIAGKNDIQWKHSFQLGATRLIEQINPSNPIKLIEIEKIENILQEIIIPLTFKLNEFPVSHLIGCSGSFETLADMVLHQKDSSLADNKQEYYDFDLYEFNDLYLRLLKSSEQERAKIPGLPEHRIDTIVMSSIFINFIIKKFHISKLSMSTAALKEGILSELMDASEF